MIRSRREWSEDTWRREIWRPEEGIWKKRTWREGIWKSEDLKGRLKRSWRHLKGIWRDQNQWINRSTKLKAGWKLFYLYIHAPALAVISWGRRCSTMAWSGQSHKHDHHMCIFLGYGVDPGSWYIWKIVGQRPSLRFWLWSNAFELQNGTVNVWYKCTESTVIYGTWRRWQTLNPMFKQSRKRVTMNEISASFPYWPTT
jgi:hypothetical protein